MAVYPLTQVRGYWEDWEKDSPLGTRWRGDELVDVHYQLEVQGIMAGWFYYLSGGEIEVAVIAHDVVYETGDSTSLLIPTTTSFQPFNLIRGFADYLLLYNWFAAASCGDIIQARRHGTITLNKREAEGYAPKVRWNFYNAWLTKIKCYSYNQYTGSSKAQLTITIRPEAIELAEL